MTCFSIRTPDDWHLHVRDGDMMALVVPHTAAHHHRAIMMPNLVPPVTTTALAEAYQQRILAVAPAGFEPLMTLYLTDNTPPDEIQRAKASGIVQGVKLYPAGATTHSDSGVTDLTHCLPALETMAELGMPLLIHGEVTDSSIDIFDREKVFIDTKLQPLVQRLPTLRIVFEHITTKDAADFVLQAGENIAATITAHHLLYHRNHMLAGGIRPHYYCLPILKRREHQEALVKAATSGNRKFFAGTDSAPHAKGKKEASCGCAGAYTAPFAVALYAEAFDHAIDLNKPESQRMFEAFMSENGPIFYGLPMNESHITLTRQSIPVPEAYTSAGGEILVPLRAGETVEWAISRA